MTFVLNWILSSIAISVAAYLVPGITPFGGVDPWLCFAFTGLFLSIVNSLVKPLISLISLPITLLTLGLFQLVVNSIMLELASSLSMSLFGAGIAISGFGAAFVGAIIVSVLTTILGLVTK